VWIVIWRRPDLKSDLVISLTPQERDRQAKEKHVREQVAVSQTFNNSILERLDREGAECASQRKWGAGGTRRKRVRHMSGNTQEAKTLRGR
jgi:ribosomal protein S11